jgi:hypothetical protein
VPAPGDYDAGEIGGMIGRGNQSTRRKPAPVPLCPPQTPHALPGRESGPPLWKYAIFTPILSPLLVFTLFTSFCKQHLNQVISEVVKAVTMKITVFWDVMPCSFIEVTNVSEACNTSIFSTEE